jgi:pimeloyl-ACP methyl ester carboxylesterase
MMKLDALMQPHAIARRLPPEQARNETMPSVRRRDVEFKSGGVTCRAWAYAPRAQASGPAPCIVMAHGLSGTRDAALEPYALRFAEAGFHVLLFDYRHLGASDGEPRQLISIAQQLADWAAAVEFARGMNGVDPERIALWGCSLSGGHVVVTAARDPRIAAISAQCPMLDGHASARMARRRDGIKSILGLLRAAVIDVTRAALGREPYYVPLAAPPGELAAMASHDAYAGCRAIMPADWRNQVAARILLAMPFYRPLRHAASVKCPALFIACTQDSVTSADAAAVAAARMGDKARLIELPIGHFDIYLGQCFERSSREQVAFFKEMLRV